jgi:Transposase IS66 family
MAVRQQVSYAVSADEKTSDIPVAWAARPHVSQVPAPMAMANTIMPLMRPIKEALDRIGQLYAVEKTINRLPPDQRRRQRQIQSKPVAEALAAWAEQTVRQLSRKSELALAFRYMRARWTALVRCFDDGRLALDNNPAERALRCVAIGRKNYLFAGSDAAAATPRTDKPLTPFENRGPGTMSRGHFGGIGFDLGLTELAPHDQPQFRPRQRCRASSADPVRISTLAAPATSSGRGSARRLVMLQRREPTPSKIQSSRREVVSKKIFAGRRIAGWVMVGCPG